MNWISRDLSTIWHPYAQMAQTVPLPIVRAKDALLFDDKGNSYIDAISSWWVINHGHCHPAIVKAIQAQLEQLEQVIFACTTHPPAVELAEAILEKLGTPFSKVFFSDNGSTAVEAALKMVIQFHYNQGKTQQGIIALKGAYHGDTFGAMAVSGKSSYTAAFDDLLFNVHYLDTPTNDNGDSLIKQLITLVELHQKQAPITAIILEPLIMGAGGMMMYSVDTLEKLVQAAKSMGIFVIIDEVMTGFGRTGSLFAIDQLQTKPDIICLSKGLTGGFMPLGLTVTTEELYQGFWSNDKSKMLYHGHSFTANPLSCVAALASLRLFDEQATWQNIARISSQHQAFIPELGKYESKILAPRSTGTVLALDLNVEDQGYLSQMAQRVYAFALQQGVMLRPLGNVVYTIPPFCTTSAEMQRIYQVIIDGLECNWEPAKTLAGAHL
jgi:adenosylmethionine---8-amino-7-oxononanoate aminotransferase